MLYSDIESREASIYHISGSTFALFPSVLSTVSAAALDRVSPMAFEYTRTAFTDGTGSQEMLSVSSMDATSDKSDLAASGSKKCSGTSVNFGVKTDIFTSS